MTPRRIKPGTTIDLATHDLTRGFRLRGDGTVTAVSLTRVIVRTPTGNYLHAPWSSAIGSTRYTYDDGVLVVTPTRRSKP